MLVSYTTWNEACKGVPEVRPEGQVPALCSREGQDMSAGVIVVPCAAVYVNAPLVIIRRGYASVSGPRLIPPLITLRTRWRCRVWRLPGNGKLIYSLGDQTRCDIG